MEEQKRIWQPEVPLRGIKHPLWVLVAVLAGTAALWAGALRVGFSTDDYLFIHHLAPIRTIFDVFRPFTDFDPNAQYWRPVADASAALDFLLWGWSGQGFHLSNFLLHLVATGLVYVLARKIFLFSPALSIGTCLAFGIAASHESNLLWPAARADTLTTIFTMLALLAHWRAVEHSGGRSRRWLWLATALAAFWLALSSKENGVLAMPLIFFLLELPALVHKSTRWPSSLARLAPYVILTVLFVVIRSQFTIPMSYAEPLASEGSRSLAVFLRNGVYSVGYTFLPLDLEQATIILRHRSLWLGIAAALLVLAAIILIYIVPREEWKKFWKPVVFTLISGVVTMESFERWRMYMPSIGLLAIFVLLVSVMWRTLKPVAPRILLAAAVLALASFHIGRALRAENNWRIAADQVQQMKQSLKAVLNEHPQRPLQLDILTLPAKLGSASVMLVGLPEFVQECEAERRSLPEMKYGDARGANLPVERAVDVFALDFANGFRGFHWKPDGTNAIIVTADSASTVRFDPSEYKLHGESRRDWHLKNGEVFPIGTNRVTILDAEGSFARSVRIQFSDTSWLPIVFDGKGFTIVR